MMRRANQRWMAIALPVGAGSAILALGLFLMPSAREVEQAERRAAPPPRRSRRHPIRFPSPRLRPCRRTPISRRR